MKAMHFVFPSALIWVCLWAVCFAQDELVSPGWAVRDAGVGTKPSFDFDTAGRLHLMGMTEAVNGVVWYAVSDSPAGPWRPDIVQEGHFYGPGDLRVGLDGTAHLAWHDHDAEDAASVSIDVAGNTRREYIQTSGSHDGWDNSLAFDSNGVLFQSSVDPSGFGATTSLSVAALNETGWEQETVEGSGSFMYGFNTSLAFDVQNEPHVLFTAAEDWTAAGDLKHAFRADNSWQIETVVTGGIRGRFPTLAYDRRGRAHAAWLDISSDDSRLASVRHGVLENGAWVISEVGVLNNVDLGFSGGRKQTSVAVDSADKVHIAYGDRRVINYATLHADGWRTERLLESDEDLYNGLVVLRFNPTNDEPVIAFWQPDNLEPGIVRMLTVATTSGDFNSDGEVDVMDIDLLAAGIRERTSDSVFDVDLSGEVDHFDLRNVVETLLNTYLGDSNLDGEFNSGDLVAVFTAGEYEDATENNSSWAEGDWDGDADFTSGDLVLAFQDGGYEQGPRMGANAVPEPTSLATLVTGLIGLTTVLRTRRRRV